LLEVVWTAEARANLAGLHAYIGQFSPLNAQHFTGKLVNAVNALAEYPDRGRPVGDGRRDFTAIWPYIVRYRVEAGAVVILRIRHGARLQD
jgi:plasmid stabilization system protein ParE